MGTECCGSSCETPRRFLTKEEKAERLNDYKEALELELQGVSEKIKELK